MQDSHKERTAQPAVAVSGLPTRDPSRQLRPTSLRGSGGRPGVIDQLVYGHPRVYTGVEDLRTAISATQIALEPVVDEMPDEAAFRERASAIILHEMVADIDSMDGLSGVLYSLADAWVYGFALSEATWYRDVSCYAGGGYRLELYNIHPSTVANWRVERGQVKSISQSTMSGGGTIQAAHLVHTTLHPSAGPEGLSQMRPFVFLYEQWKAAHLDTADRRSTEAGLLKLRTPKTADTESTNRLLDYAERYISGESRVLLLPDGYDVEVVTPPSIADSHIGFFEYIDAQADRLMGAILASLGYASHGSRALGEAVAEREAWTRRDKLDRLLSVWGRRVLTLIADALGYRGRLPTIVSVGEEYTSVAERVDLLVRASSLTGWGDEDRDQLRSELGLSQIQPAPVEMSSCCGTSVELAAKDWPMQTDVTGAQVAFPRPFRGAELDVAWYQVFEQRQSIDVQFEAAIEQIRAEQERATFRALADGVLSRDERRRLVDEYGERYAEVIAAYLERIRSAVSEQTRQEAARAQSRGAVVPIDETPDLGVLDEYQSLRASTEAADIERIADVMASRVTSEIDSRVSSGVGTAAERVARVADGYISRISVGGLTQEARGLGSRVESNGRAESAASVGGVVPVQLVRATVWDRARCGHCESMDGVTVDLTDPQIGPDQIPALPDPDCDGGAERCRCGWIIVWGSTE